MGSIQGLRPCRDCGNPPGVGLEGVDIWIGCCKYLLMFEKFPNLPQADLAKWNQNGDWDFPEEVNTSLAPMAAAKWNQLVLGE